MTEKQLPGLHQFEIVEEHGVGELIDERALRDVLIRAFWAGLSYHGELSYRQRLEVVMERFHIGHVTAEKAVRISPPSNGNGTGTRVDTAARPL